MWNTTFYLGSCSELMSFICDNSFLLLKKLPIYYDLNPFNAKVMQRFAKIPFEASKSVFFLCLFVNDFNWFNIHLCTG